jgi:hypothetical protein
VFQKSYFFSLLTFLKINVSLQSCNLK